MSDERKRPQGWRCLCEGSHEPGCPWGAYQRPPCPKCGKVGKYTLDNGGCCYINCPTPR